MGMKKKLPRRVELESPNDLRNRLKAGLEKKAEQRYLEDLERDHRRTFKRDDFYREITNLIDDGLPDDESNLYAIKNALTPHLNLIYKAAQYYESKYRDALNLAKGFPWPKWIRDPQIQRAIGKTRFQDCMDYAWNHKGPEKKSIELAEKKGIEPAKIRKIKHRELIDHWMLTHFDFIDMALELSTIKPISPSIARRTIRAIAKAEIFEDMGKIGSHGQTIYKIGIWRPFWNKEEQKWGLKPEPLLTKEKHSEILERFNIKGK